MVLLAVALVVHWSFKVNLKPYFVYVIIETMTTQSMIVTYNLHTHAIFFDDVSSK